MTLEEQLKRNEAIAARDPGKILGECEVCGFDTVLVEITGMCGPCTWGEADTINGNW